MLEAPNKTISLAATIRVKRKATSNKKSPKREEGGFQITTWDHEQKRSVWYCVTVLLAPVEWGRICRECAQMSEGALLERGRTGPRMER